MDILNANELESWNKGSSGVTHAAGKTGSMHLESTVAHPATTLSSEPCHASRSQPSPSTSPIDSIDACCLIVRSTAVAWLVPTLQPHVLWS